MKRRVLSGWLVALTIMAAMLSGCSRDPNVRKQKYLESGRRYLDKGKYPEAVIQFSNALQVDPSFAEGHYQLAQAYLKLQDWQHAYQQLSRTVELQPDNYAAMADLASLLIAGGDYKQAKEQIDVLLQRRPNDPKVHSTYANWYAAQENFTAAEQEMQKTIALDPGRWESYMNMGLLQVRTNQMEQAEASLRKAVELGPNTASTHLTLGNFYQSKQRFAEAEQQFQQAVAADAQNPDPRSALARVYMQQGKGAEAISLLQKTKEDLAGNSIGYRMLGDFYFATGDLEHATTEYESLYKDHPKDLQVKKNYIQLLILRERLDEAAKLNDEILKKSPSDVDALIYRGQIEIRQGSAEQAVNTLQKAIENDPNNGVAHYHLGIAFDALRNIQQAEGAWRDAIRLRPDLAEAHRALAASALRRGNMEVLQASAERLIALEPGSPEGYALRALSFTKRGMYGPAEADARQAIALGPQGPVGYIQLGVLRVAQQKYSEAEKAYQQALQFDPTALDAIKGLVDTYLAQKQPAPAIALLRGQITKNHRSSVLYNLLGTVLFEQKGDSRNLDEVEAMFKKAAELDPQNPDALLKLAQVQSTRGKTDDALAACQQAATLYPREAAFLVLAGDLHESKDMWKEAAEDYQKALDVDPDNAMAANNLAYVMTKTGGNLDVALSLAQTARRQLPESYNVADTLGWVLYQKGLYKPAVRLFQESLKLAEKNREPDDPTVHYHLGLIYEKTGQTPLARQHLERALQLDPNSSSGDEARKLLADLRK